MTIQCQYQGELAYGSRIWDKVGGYYVPDQLHQDLHRRLHQRLAALRGASPAEPPAPAAARDPAAAAGSDAATPRRRRRRLDPEQRLKGTTAPRSGR